MSIGLVTLALQAETDVVAARQRARQVAALLGFDGQDQARIATAVSEIARNAFRYAGGGEVAFSVEGRRAPQLLGIEVRDKGPGIAHLESVLEGTYQSQTGMGLGIVGAQRLMDFCHVQTSPEGTTVTLKKVLPRGAPVFDGAAAARLARELHARIPPTPFEEVLEQNRELIRALGALREKQEELLAVNRELEDTNRGVVALYAELAERADSLRRADETKTRFFSNMSHEFRTPLNSIRALSNVLLDRVDGDLNEEQELQVRFIQKAADELSGMVNDLLDLAKIEAGKLVVRPREFTIDELFSAMRGMLRPLLMGDRVSLQFEAAPDAPRLYTDEGKVSQILRNLISNALKYTEAGTIRVEARPVDGGRSVALTVADTGIGIAPEDMDLIFEEFVQIPNPLQARNKGTGLGLPLSRRLAIALGGGIRVESEPGRGSTFTATLPVRYREEAPEPPLQDEQLRAEPSRMQVLVVEDSAEELAYYERLFRSTAYVPIQARNLRQASDALVRANPVAILLDVRLGEEESWGWLGELKSRPPSATVPPVILATAAGDPRKAFAMGADAFLEKPVGRAALLETLNRLTGAKILVIDDDPAFRYFVRKLCDPGYQVLEAGDAQEGLRSAMLMQPDFVVLDLNLPDHRGEHVLEQLKADRDTRGIPVVIVTSETLAPARRAALAEKAVAVLGKDDFSGGALRELLSTRRVRSGEVA